jgi:hypothetical protein
MNSGVVLTSGDARFIASSASPVAGRGFTQVRGGSRGVVDRISIYGRQ